MMASGLYFSIDLNGAVMYARLMKDDSIFDMIGVSKNVADQAAAAIDNALAADPEVEVPLDKEIAANSEAAGGEVEFSIVELSDGKKYVKADRTVVTGNDPSRWGQQITDYINAEIRKGKDVTVYSENGVPLTITRDTAGKAAFRNFVELRDGSKRLMYDTEYALKIRAEGHIDELAQVSRGTGGTARDTKGHIFARDGFNYRTAYFLDQTGYYELRLSIGKYGRINTVYNVGTIKEVDFPTSGLKGPARSKTEKGNQTSSDIIRNADEKNNPNFSENPITENPEIRAAMDRARRLFDAGIHFLSYYQREDSDPNVAKFLRGIWDSANKVDVLGRALELYKAGKSVEDYYKESPKDYNHQVAKQLRGMIIRNGKSVGGMLGKTELDGIMEIMQETKSIPAAVLTFTSPVRVYENIAGNISGKTSQDRARSYLAGERLKDAYYEYGNIAAANRAKWIEDNRAAVFDAFTKNGKAGVQESSIILHYTIRARKARARRASPPGRRKPV